MSEWARAGRETHTEAATTTSVGEHDRLDGDGEMMVTAEGAARWFEYGATTEASWARCRLNRAEARAAMNGCDGNPTEAERRRARHGGAKDWAVGGELNVAGL